MKIHEYNEMMRYLTKPGPSKKVQSLRKKINEQPNASVEELVNQVQKEFSEDKITTQQRPSALDKASTNLIRGHVKFDEDEDLSVSYNPTTKIFSNKSRTIGFQKYEDADKYNKLIGAKTSPYPKEATPEQVKYLKNNLDKIKQQTTAEKLNGDRKARKYILNQVKNKTTVPEFKLNTEVPSARPSTPEPVKPEPVKPVTREDTIKAIEEWAKSQPKRDEDMTGIFATNQYFLRKRGL